MQAVPLIPHFGEGLHHGWLVRDLGLPTAIIHTAEFDPMRDEGNAYAHKLLAAGVAVDHVCHEGMIHNFHAIGAILPQGRLVLRQIGEQVRRAFGG